MYLDRMYTQIFVWYPNFPYIDISYFPAEYL